jgi:hypothetical protein
MRSSYEEPVTSALQASEFAAPAMLARWYRLFAPTPPTGRSVTLHEREQIRRGRLASIILAVQLVGIEIPVIPVVMHAPNGHIVLPWLFGCIFALLAAFVFNKQGHLTIAGILMVASIEVTMIVKILTVPGGISVFYLPQFDILIQPILIAVALLVPWSAFAVAMFNISFILLALTVGPHAPDLLMALHNPTQTGDLFAVPIMAQILTSFFGWIIVKNLLEALKQADTAEQVALLEHMLAQSRRDAEERNQLLEQGITAIIATIQKISAGESRARISLPQGHILWPITMQLNHFFDRYQSARQADSKLAMTTEAIHELANEIHLALQQQRAPKLVRRQTPLDTVIMAMLGMAKVTSTKGELVEQEQNQLLTEHRRGT